MKQFFFILVVSMLFFGFEGVFAQEVEAKGGFVTHIDITSAPISRNWDYFELNKTQDYSVVLASTGTNLPTTFEGVSAKKIDNLLGFQGAYDRAEKLFTNEYVYENMTSSGFQVENTSTGAFLFNEDLVFVSSSDHMIIPKTKTLNFYYLI